MRKITALGHGGINPATLDTGMRQPVLNLSSPGQDTVLDENA
jgi:hypothetical protein